MYFYRVLQYKTNEVKIPKLGLGIWFIPNGQAAEAVRNAAADLVIGDADMEILKKLLSI